MIGGKSEEKLWESGEIVVYVIEMIGEKTMQCSGCLRVKVAGQMQSRLLRVVVGYLRQRSP